MPDPREARYRFHWRDDSETEGPGLCALDALYRMGRHWSCLSAVEWFVILEAKA